MQHMDTTGTFPISILVPTQRQLPRAVDPHLFFADPDPASFSPCGFGSSCFSNADPDPALKSYKKITL